MSFMHFAGILFLVAVVGVSIRLVRDNRRNVGRRVRRSWVAGPSGIDVAGAAADESDAMYAGAFFGGLGDAGGADVDAVAGVDGALDTCDVGDFDFGVCDVGGFDFGGDFGGDF